MKSFVAVVVLLASVDNAEAVAPRLPLVGNMLQPIRVSIGTPFPFP
jgi:hypothetical protein